MTDCPMTREERLQKKIDDEKLMREQEIQNRALEKLEVKMIFCEPLNY